MKTGTRTFSAILLGLGLITASAAANARDHHGNGWGHERHEHDYRSYGRYDDVRVVERRYVVREAPRYYYEPMVYERPRPVYRTEPGVVVSIGLPPIIIPFR